MHFATMKYRLTIILMLLVSMHSLAQKLEYSVLMHGIGDNREFGKSMKAKSQTILGERVSFEIGTTIDEQHQFRAGLSHLFEFGSDLDFNKPKLTAYYHFLDEKTEFYFGAFPRMDLIDYPLAMLTDTLQYYRPNVEGMYGKYQWDWGHQAAFIDWTGRQTETVHEAFLAGSSGKIKMKSFFFENYLIMYHYAGTLYRDPDFHVQDNAAVSFYLGSDLTDILPLQKSSIKVGNLGSFFKERSVNEDFITAWSFVGEFYGEIKNFALRTTLHQGQGHRITMGDRFYNVDSYLRTDVYWYFINSKHVQGKFNLSFHLVEGSFLDQSQQLSLVYKFEN